MGRQYSARTFLRNVPNDLLHKYFDALGVDLGFNWVMLGETEVNPIFVAVEGLDATTRSRIDSDFRSVNELACESGTLDLIAEARNAGLDWSGPFGRMRSAYERAMWAFLTDLRVFRTAGNFHEMDRKGGWRRRPVGTGLAAATDEAAIRRFERRLQLFYRRQGRGRFCHVDYYLRSEPTRHCYFAYPEDYASVDVGYDEHGRFQQRARRSAFEIIFVYRPEEGVVDLRARGDRRQIDELLRIFGVEILGLPDLPDHSGPEPFDLDLLLQPGLTFSTDPADRIAAVYVRQLRLDLPGPDSRKLTVQANSCHRWPRAVHGLLDEVISRGSLSLEEVKVAQARLQFIFAGVNGERPRSLTFELGLPDRCTLKDDPLDQIARKYLQIWGITHA